ncbi:MAG: arginine--tRNA ligase [Nanoarchaeota archaeon]|nr:arginine--tRNA ligase [Nanoarchaeota archaeon]
MNANKKLQSEVLKLLQKHVSKKQAEELLEKPPEEIGADLALPCFAFAKKYRKNPAEIAKDIASKLNPSGLIREVRPVGPYVNFYADSEKIASMVLKDVLKERNAYGKSKTGKGKRLMVEYVQTNPYKAFHIGHVRNIALGESLCRVLESTGNKIIRANYQGDIGPHVAKALWGLINIYNSKPPKDVDKGLWIGEVYRESNEKASLNQKVAEEIDEINKKLYDGDKKLLPLWKKGKKWSLDYFDKIYKDFGANFDRLYMESEVEKPGRKIVKELHKKGIAEISEGAMIVDLKKYNLPVFLVLRRDGIALYSTKDLALAEMQEKEYHPDKIIHVVGSEQKLHFQQLIKTIGIYNKKLADKEYHLSYELVILPSGKMKSREGKVILYGDLKRKMYALALKATKEKNPSLPVAQHKKIAEQVALGAIKYNMIMQSPEKVIVFDWNQALDFQGNSAPYVQYTHARACSILKKAKVKTIKDFDPSLLVDKKEIKLIKTISEFPQVVENAAKDYRPHYIASYVHNLASIFNEFYQTLPVLKADKNTAAARLALVKATQITLKNALQLLGIEAPEKM